MNEGRKIGVFGGTFDPVHKGHLGLADFVLGQGLVDQILFLPAARPPHKQPARASFSHRTAMLKTAIAGHPAMAVSDLEARRPGPSYTADTLRALHGEYPGDRLFFLMGADSLLELHLWHEVDSILKMADLVVVARDGCEDAACFSALRALPGRFAPDPDQGCWQRADGARIWYLRGFSFPCSSSEIRKRLQQGRPTPELLPATASFIKKNALYS